MSFPTSPGAPGLPPRWTSAAKEGVGTAYSSDAHVWFTLSHGIINEIYFPHVDTPNTRDLQFLITDGETFVHEEKKDLQHKIEYPEKNALLYRLTNSDPEGRYRLFKEIIIEPHSSVLLMHTRVEILDETLRGKLRLYALLAPHLKGTGNGNSAWLCETGNRKLFGSHREGIEMAFGCEPDFVRRSVGYVGTSDGWQDITRHREMRWEHHEATNGNLAMTGEIDLSAGLEFTLGVGFGSTPHSAATHILQAFATPFADQRRKFVEQWQRTRFHQKFDSLTSDEGSMLRLSQCVLLAHEDKFFRGAFVASLSIPWGEAKDDSDLGGYHLVWARDMVQTATGLLACGRTESPLRALVWLACIQDDDGSLPQNSFINGRPYWTGTQLDEVAAPVLLAWRLQRADALRQFDPWSLIANAARFLILHGPVTAQERWEENAGYSPSTLATVIAALVIAAEFARDHDQAAAATLFLDYADWLVSHLEDWMVTTRGDLLEGTPRHYLRITPADPANPLAAPDPDHAEIQIANGGGRHPARNIVGGDFLHLVRLGIRPPDDRAILDSLRVIDHVIKRELPQGPGWRRYNFDGYGQKADGSAFDGTGEGRCWPILTGERAHYELTAGGDVKSWIKTMEDFANCGGMMPEQVWDAEEIPDGRMKPGHPTGAAMPLCWSHAEYLSLVRSAHDGVCFDRIDPVHQRYGVENTGSSIEMWTFAHQIQEIAPGKILRLILDQPASVVWSTDEWATIRELETHDSGIGCWTADFSHQDLKDSTGFVFTFRFATRWHGENHRVRISPPNSNNLIQQKK